MITLHCDKCDKPFEVEDDAAGEKVECPYCGDINRVPAAPAVAPVGRKAASISKPVAAEPEATIVIVRQAMFRAHPFWFSLMVLSFIGGIVLASMAKTSKHFADARWLVWVGIGLSVCAFLWWLFWWLAPHRWVKLTITTKRTIRQEGIVVRKTSEVLHDHIRNVKIEQSVMQRLLGVGSIWIDSAGGASDQAVEIEMHDVAKPYSVKQIIDKYRNM